MNLAQKEKLKERGLMALFSILYLILIYLTYNYSITLRGDGL